MKKVGILGLLQESNTFISGKTTLDHFHEDLFLSGEAIRNKMVDAHHEVSGFFAGLETAGIEAIPIFLTRALPFGVIEATAFNTLVETLLSELEKHLPLDAILAAPHGATVAEKLLDSGPPNRIRFCPVRSMPAATVSLTGVTNTSSVITPVAGHG